ncbi:hypothetical protein H6P81_011833 [Aristolochia fimbriata]|uniref:RING-type domain-containing protein n=1 Tax=Aristolochia fimbriata TaxID=158543 RepID=A0AAV7EC87_ARIFI|nr:hypothetical protein H6P81_011833 [Aristolochia fimbriata]
MEGGRRRPMLTGTMSIRERDPSKLRELLKVTEEEDQKMDGDGVGDKPPVASAAALPSRTLLDIIREEETIKYGHGGHKINWKSFKDRLRMRRTGSAWADYGAAISVTDDFMHAIPVGTAPPQAAASAAEAPVPAPDGASSSGGEEPAGGAAEVAEEEAPPVRVSLMALLEQTDRQSAPLSDDGGKDSGTEEEEEEEEESGEGAEYACCVCMVRHKGAAFIPCGHTFCRLCSRELWVSRGNCPLCNGYILEILDIF